MAVFHADALVIRTRDYGESDRIITLFARDRGKLQAIAKGARKPKSKQRAGTQLFTYADFLLHKGQSLNTINQVSPKESFSHLWGDLERSLAATGMAELLDIATIPEQPHPELFTLTLSYFFLLEHFDPCVLQSAYALRLLSHLGYRPYLGECVECRENVANARVWFSPEAGGTLCPRCQRSFTGRWLQAGSLAFMRQLLQADLTRLDRLRWNTRMRTEIKDALQAYCEQKFERSLRSWGVGNLIAENVGQHNDGKEGKPDERSVVDRDRED